VSLWRDEKKSHAFSLLPKPSGSIINKGDFIFWKPILLFIETKGG
jgi:hypothetical protein